ncbi:Two component regulator propeller [Salegentibacter echinorum]|uniref:histidine kinase n=1 Tax=Salegentibacter echinorum TaxID=1073325 RepID=A0A1M5HGA7_SALEC|nr:hybrid sensor histidine kinase/response regulator transcription factor [Salegentibacter echinorum]SHG14985.1 Two component regulator propeller [Salegentibacter echinorum]
MIRNTCLIILLCFVSHSYAQNGDFIFKHLSSSDGLSQGSVISIHQDKLGQMWLGTRDGLNKYDGNAFTVYKNNPKDSLSISNSDILSIEEDERGFLWIGTYNGLNKFNPLKNRFERYFHDDEPTSLSNNTIWSVEELNDGQIWVGTSNGLSIYNRENNNFKTLFYSGDDSSSIPGNYVLKIFQNKHGEVYVGTSQGLAKWEKEKGTYSFTRYNRKIFIQDIIEDNAGNLWVGTKNKGLYKLNVKTDKLEKYTHGGEEEIDKDIRALTIDKKSRLWIGTYNGLAIINANGELHKVVNKPFKNTSLSKNTIKSIYTDKKGSVWIGAYYGGVNIWDESNSNFINYNKDGSENQLSYDVVSSIEKDDENNIYFGTEGGGISVLDYNTKNSSYINTATFKELPSENIKALRFSVDNQNLWIGTYNEGLGVFDVQRKRFVNDIIPDSLQELLKHTGVYSIREDEKNVWIGTFGKGLINFNRIKETFKLYEHSLDNSVSLSNNRIRTILIDSEENIWAATQKGLNKIIPAKSSKDVSIEHFFYDKNDNAGDDVLSVFEDSKDKIWVGTKSKGLFFYKDGIFNPVDLLRNSQEIIAPIHAILEDKNDNLWLSTNEGILKYNPATKEVSHYNESEGLISNEFNNNASLKFNEELFFFGGPAGVSSFNPNKIVLNNYSPQVILTNFKIKNESINTGENDILNKSIAYTESINLSYDKANFSIGFATPNFINSSSNKYAYRLVGLEEEWTNTTKNEVNYTIQNAGTYTFEVKGANNDGVWNDTPTTLKIEVKPAPWKSAWAFILYALLIGLALYGLIWIMKSKTKLKHELELEQVEKERNQAVTNAKVQFFTNISHEFRTPLTLILGPLQQLLSSYKGSNKMYKKLLVVESNANHLLQLINRLMDFRKLENNQFKLEAAEGNIVKFLKEIYLSFDEFAQDGNYDYTFETSDEEIFVYYDRGKLERVFYNLISNAFRYTPNGGKIHLRIEKEDTQINIALEDSGIGIENENLDKVFDRFFEIEKPKANQPYNQGTGIGLSIAKNIVKLHKGEILVNSEGINKGAVFQVKLKLGKEHLSEEEIIKDFKFSDDLSLYANQVKNPDILLKRDIEDLVLDKERETILVVEDNAPLRTFIKNLLKDDYNILEAENGRVALKMTLKHMPHLIISDVIMPEMVGTELCAQIKNNIKTSHIPVILLTSRSSLIYKVEGLESGADDYISKPFDIKEFVLRVKNHLDSTKRLKNKFVHENKLAPAELTVSSMDEELLEKALKIVEDNIDNEQFNIPTFSAELGVSRTMLFTKIKAWTNYTPNEFINEIRMKRAAQLLEQGKINVSQISYKVGFRSPKYFAKCFQKKYDLTPSQYVEKFYDDISTTS